VGVDPSTGTVYVANEDSNTVSVISEATGTVTATIGVGSSPCGVGVDPGTHGVYVANDVSNTVSVITSTGTPTITTTSLPSGTVGTGYSQALAATGGAPPYTWTLAFGSLPPGLSLSGSGSISGTPTTAGSYSFTVQATDSSTPQLTATQGLTVTVGQASQSIGLSAPATGIAGQSAALTATGGGSGNAVVLTVDPSSGTGVCTVSGTDGTTVNYAAAGSCVIDANQAGNANYTAAPTVTATITVYQAAAFVLDSPPLAAVAGQPYDYTFEASGTPAPTYALAPGAPTWLSVSASTGEVTGTPPTGTTSFSYGVTATNAAGTATAGPFSVTVTKASSNADISGVLTCPSGITVGHTGTCTLTVADAGPAGASKVVAGVLLPPALSEVSCTSGCARYANVFTWSLASLAKGASAQFSITVKASAAGKVLVLAAAASQNPDPNPLNNISLQQITITR
jgi:YVTN family beta-propeller protein